MKKILPILFLLVSCATTKNSNYSNYEENETGYIFSDFSETVETNYSPNYSIIAFDVLGKPFLYTWFFVRETGRILIYSTTNITIGMFATEIDDIWLPDTERTKQELEELELEFYGEETIKYKDFVKEWAVTELNVTNVETDSRLSNDKLEVSTKTYILQDTVEDNVKRLSKKSSLIGEQIGEVIVPIITWPSFIIGIIMRILFDR